MLYRRVRLLGVGSGEGGRESRKRGFPKLSEQQRDDNQEHNRCLEGLSAALEEEMLHLLPMRPRPPPDD